MPDPPKKKHEIELNLGDILDVPNPVGEAQVTDRTCSPTKTEHISLSAEELVRVRNFFKLIRKERNEPPSEPGGPPSPRTH